ncbi:MAG TPA: hypothetical protein H9932_09145 [Candidatus Brachybacterium intestinipullorum]|uniref:Uncharacterized protein n=1 Tax=Candidatus Brachybacterium intestinipullorum TaxID=2838512 RepID=A0A9D2PZ21_9MICO|nr:hypothetical protein [Candidatus Brachybacterium intestinipullorum]
MRTATLENTLRELDPAPPTGDGLPARAGADLRRILATPRDSGDRSDHSPVGDRPAVGARPLVGRPRRARWRVGLVAVAAATLTVTTGVVGVDILRPTTASATWTPVGDTVPADAPGAQQCEQWWQVESSELRPVLQERRGDTTLVLGVDGAGRELLCTATLTDGQEPTGGMTSLTEPPTAELGSDGVSATFVDTTFQEAMLQNGWQAEGSTAVAGDVGADVTRMVLETDAGPVEATLAGGRFAAWWPIEDDEDPHPVVDATVTTADGATRTVTLREGA